MSNIRTPTCSINAAIYLGGLSRTLLGSNDCVKCVVDNNKEIFVRSAALLLQNIEVQHPIGQYVVSACHSFHHQHGTAVKTFLFLIGAFTQAANNLLDKGIPVAVIIDGMEKAVDLCCQKMLETSTSISEIINIQQKQAPLKNVELTANCAVIGPSISNGDRKSVEGQMNFDKVARTTKSIAEKNTEVVTQKSKLLDLNGISKCNLLSHACEEHCSVSQTNKNTLFPGMYCHLSSDTEDSEMFEKTSVQVSEKSPDTNMDLISVAETEKTLLEKRLPAQGDTRCSSYDEDIAWFFEDDNSLDCITSSLTEQEQIILKDLKNETTNSEKETPPSSSCKKMTQRSDNSCCKESDDELECCHGNTKDLLEEISLNTDLNTKLKQEEDFNSDFEDCFEGIESREKCHQYDSDVSVNDGGVDEHEDEEFAHCFQSKMINRIQQLKDVTQLNPTQQSQKVDAPMDGLQQTGFQNRNTELENENREENIDLINFDKLLKVKGIQMGKKSSCATAVLNKSRHFKTIESSVQELQALTGQNHGIDEDITQSAANVKYCLQQKHFNTKFHVNDMLDGVTDNDDAKNSVMKSCNPHRQLKTNSKQVENLDTLQWRQKGTDNGGIGTDNGGITQSSSALYSRLQTVRARLPHSRHLGNKSEISNFIDINSTKKGNPDLGLQSEKEDGVSKTEHTSFILPRSLKHESKEWTSVFSSVVRNFECCDIEDRWSWLRILGQGLSHGADRIMNVVIDAVINQSNMDRTGENYFHESTSLDVTRLHCCTILGPVCSKPQLVQGIVLSIPHQVVPLVQKHQGKQLRSLMINGDVSRRFHHIGYKKAITVTEFCTTDSYLHTRADWLTSVLQTLQHFSINVIMARGSICEEVKVICETHDIIAVENIPYSAMLTMCTVTQTIMTSYLIDCCQENICDSMSLSVYDEDWMCCYRDSSYIKVTCGKMPLQTCVISQPSLAMGHIGEQKFWRCANCLSSALRTGKVTDGAGQTEKLCAEYLLEQAESFMKQPHTQSSWGSSDVFYPAIYEETCSALEDYSLVVKRNACLQNDFPSRIPNSSNSVQPTRLRDPVHADESKCTFENLQINFAGISDNTSLHHQNTSLHHQYGDSLTLTDVPKHFTSYSSSTVTSSSVNTCNVRLTENQEITGHGECLVLDDLDSKMAAFKAAFETVRTVIQCDAYITTGLCNVETSNGMQTDFIGNNVLL